jgi:TrmH family RNA methyltransferase
MIFLQTGFSRGKKYLSQKYIISMVSKNQIKLITGLQQKKLRQANGLFIAEGVKVVGELLQSDFVLNHLYTTEPQFGEIPDYKKTIINESDLKKISALTTPNNCLALFEIPTTKEIDDKGLIVALDDIRDPGNLGTILRLCDWFGVSQLICSNETADIYNPKVVQASMGSISRVAVDYVDLADFISKTKLPVLGTFMDGKNIYKETLPEQGIVVFGNEANGISSSVGKAVKNRLSIPRFGDLQLTESLNVATATAIVLSEFRRK